MKIQIKILNKGFYGNINQYYDHSLFGLMNNGTPNNLPQYATAGSAAMDLVCTEDVTISPGEVKMISTGLAIWVGSGLRKTTLEQRYKLAHHGVAALIIPRSGLGTRGLVLSNTVGVIDEDYQGQLMVSTWNRNERGDPILYEYPNIGIKGDSNDIELKAGDRFAQIMFIPVMKVQWDVVEEFSENTSRGEGCLGSTDK